MSKYSLSFKLKVVQHYLSGPEGQRATAKRFGIDHSAVRKWSAVWKLHGVAGLTTRHFTYSPAFKESVIRDDVLADSQRFNIKLTGFDTWNATHLRTQLQGAGLDVEPFPQTYMKFSPVAKSAEVFVNRKVIQHNGDPVLAWAMSNVVMETDANANIKPNKKKAANKIDPAIAFLMSFGTYQIEHEDFAYTLSEEQQQRLKEFSGV
ncbi:hypothetical protein CBW58_15120 [Yersinia frederiksenii]|nr:hypothetical protein CBW58_15120 [Yersinia frederiksenii]